MRIFSCQQGSPEWFALRSGIPTASRFHLLVTSSGQRSRSFDRLLRSLAQERLCPGNPSVDPQTSAMLRGQRLESEARGFFEVWFGEHIEQVGFILHDSGLCGCSPDGLLSGAGLEIKCPLLKTHLSYVEQGILPARYKAQVQGSMFVTGLDRWFFLSYHPGQAPLIVEVRKEPTFIEELRSAIWDINARLEDLGAVRLMQL